MLLILPSHVRAVVWVAAFRKAGNATRGTESPDDFTIDETVPLISGITSDPTAGTYHELETIDVKGVGKLMEMAVTLGRGEKKDLKIGICGEHGGDPKSIEFFHSIGLAYVSCSPYRIPIAKLAVAQNEIRSKNNK